MTMRLEIILGVTVMMLIPAAEAEESDLQSSVDFHASFDDAVVAEIAGGQKTLNTRFNHPTESGQYEFEQGFDKETFRIAKDRGISDGALEAIDVLPRNGRVFFPARGNLPFDPQGWGGTLSVWCKTDPNQFLKTTFCDPIQITHKGSGNGGLWFDFNNAKPRDMRHGAFPAIPPMGRGIAENDPQAPLIRVPNINWKAEHWHHVVMTWSNFDTGKKNALSKLFIDGKLIGEIRNHAIAMNWDLDKTGIYVAVNYIGLLDELAIFRRPVSLEEVQQLYRHPDCLKQR